MKNRRLALVVGLVVLCTVAVSLYAIADCGKPDCGAGGAQMSAGCGPAAGGCAKMAKGGYGMRSGGRLSPAVTRSYSDGVVKLRVGACGAMLLAVLEQGNRPDSDASLSAEFTTAEGGQPVAFKRVAPGVFRALPGVAGPGKLSVRVNSGGGAADRVTFDVAAPVGGRGLGCQMKAGCGCAMQGAGGGCGKQQGGCALMSSAGTACTATAGGCSKMGQGGCATAGACKQQGAKTAACKCDVCKCSPCECK